MIGKDKLHHVLHALHAIIELNLGEAGDVQLAGFIRIVARPLESFLRGCQEAFHQVRLFRDHLVGGDECRGVNLEADGNERQRDDLLTCLHGGFVDVIFMDRIEGRRIDILGDELHRHRRTVHVGPDDLVRIGTGLGGNRGEVKAMAVARCDTDLLAFETLEIGNT